MTAPTLAGICRADRDVQHPLSANDLVELNAELYADGITVKVEGPERGTRIVVLHPALALTTERQVHAARLVVDRTDATVRWAGVAW
jgi:hypothetical protein